MDYEILLYVQQTAVLELVVLMLKASPLLKATVLPILVYQLTILGEGPSYEQWPLS